MECRLYYVQERAEAASSAVRFDTRRARMFACVALKVELLTKNPNQMMIF